MHATTIVAVRHKDKVAMAGDGQVTQDGQHVIMKHNAKKVRRLWHGGVLAGFAGSVADAVTLMERFEAKLEQYGGDLGRSAVELAKDWRGDRVLRRLEALLLLADAKHLLIVSGGGEVIEPDDGVGAIGSGAPYALAAARALVRHGESLSAADVAKEAMLITSQICIYTNDHITLEEL